MILSGRDGWEREIVSQERPLVPHKFVSCVRLNKHTEEHAVLYLVERAREIGADAIVILGEVSAGTVAMPAGTLALAIPLRDLQALAIRYE